MVYQYIFGRDTVSGYKTINVSEKLKADGEDTWQAQLNIEYSPPANIERDYPEPVVYFNIKNKIAVIGKIIYQVLQQRKNYMQHYYLIDDINRNEFLEKNYQFDVSHFENDIDTAYTTDIENQDIYNHMSFDIEEAKNIISSQKISKKVLELIIFACFEAVSSDKRIFFINDVSDKTSTDNNLDLLKIIFSVLPIEFKENLGFITYYKYLISPTGKELRSDIRLVFTENSEQNINDRKRIVEDGNYLFDFANNKTAVTTENIIYYSLLEFLTQPFFGECSIDEVTNVIDNIKKCFLDPYKLNYNLASIIYEILYKQRSINFDIANILFENLDIFSDEIKTKLNNWFLSDEINLENVDSKTNSLLFKVYQYEEYKDNIIQYFAQQITNTKESKYVDIIFDKQAPFKLMEDVCKKLFNEDKFLEGGKFLIYNSIGESENKNIHTFNSIKILDVLKYFYNFSNHYYKYFDELEIYNNYIKESIEKLDISEIKNLSNYLLDIINNISDENTNNKFKELHKLILKGYILSKFDSIESDNNLFTDITTCFDLINCASVEMNYLQNDIKYGFRKFSLNIISEKNISTFSNIEHYLKKAIENRKNIDRFLDIVEEVLIKSFNKKDLSTDEYNRLLRYAKDLDININTRNIKNFELFEFKSKLEKCMCYNDTPNILDIIKNQYSYFKPNDKEKLINWLKKGYAGNKDNKFFRLIIYLYGNDYNEMFSFIDNNDNYESLKAYMKEVKNAGQLNNKHYIRALSNYIREDKKLKKYLKNLSSMQKREIGLNFSPANAKQSDDKNYSVNSFITNCLLIGILITLIERIINSVFSIDNMLITIIINCIAIVGIYSWGNKIFDELIIKRMLIGIFSILFFVNVLAGVLGILQLKNPITIAYKNFYNIKYDNLPPDIKIQNAFVQHNGNIEVISDILDKIDVYDGSNITISFEAQDNNEFETNIMLNETAKIMENKNVIQINSDELNEQGNKLTIMCEDVYKNISKIDLDIVKKEIENNLEVKLESTMYNSKWEAIEQHTNLEDGFQLSIPKSSNMVLSLDIKSDSRNNINVTFNDTLMPLQDFVFLEDGISGKINIKYDDLEDGDNALIVVVSGQEEIKEYKFNVVKLME